MKERPFGTEQMMIKKPLANRYASLCRPKCLVNVTIDRSQDLRRYAGAIQ